MSTKKMTKSQMRTRRHARVRSRIVGTKECPRLCVSRSLRGLFLQLVDDEHGITIVSIRSKKDLPKKGDVGERTGKVAQAYLLGVALADKAKEKDITRVVFDRGGHAYHGRVQAVADGARAGGLAF